MKYLDLTLRTPAENVACDEALLDYCDATRECGVLRFWEPKEHFVVVGYSNKVPLEVNVDACRKNGVVILRRCSGGGTVLQGPGCLNYSLVLRIDSDPALQTVTGTNRFVMERNRAALASLITTIRNDLNEPSPKSSIQHPASGIQHPVSSIRHPASGIQHPASSIQHPASSIQHPPSGIEHLRPGSHRSDTSQPQIFRERATKAASRGFVSWHVSPQPGFSAHGQIAANAIQTA